MEIKIFSLAASVIIVFLVIVESSGDDPMPHRCIHDQITKYFPRSSIPHLGSEGARAKRQTDDYLPYRIAVHYVVENITNVSTVIPWLSDPSQGFQMAINYLQNVLSVIRADHNLTISPNCTATNSTNQCTSVSKLRTCGPHVTIPDEHLGTIIVCDPTCHEVGGDNVGVDADFIYYVTALNDQYCNGSTLLAYASSCFLDADDNRPLAGFTNICPTQSFQYGTQGFFMLMLHETLHALGFSSRDFQNFVDEEGNQYNGTTYVTVNGATVLAVNSPKVLSYGREYYNCPNLEGVLLENEGSNVSAYSHWEARTLSYEVMVAAGVEHESYYTSISNFTLNLLEDSGWYKVDYATAKSLYNFELLWGKGEGCEFVYGDCDAWAYSCSPLNTIGCSYDYQALSRCIDISFYDNCSRFYTPHNGFCNLPGAQRTNSCFPLMAPDEHYGHFGACYGHECWKFSDSPRLFYTVRKPGVEQVQVCFNGGEIETFNDGTVFTCPPPELVCSRNTSIIETQLVPPALCDDSCATCMLPYNPAYCLNCSDSLSLLTEAPSLCVPQNYSCTNGTFPTGGGCASCAAGCRACTGPNNSDCLACKDDTLYRVTTDQPRTSVCVTAAECINPVIDEFGGRTCSMVKTNTGGASSVQYHQYLLLLLLLLYPLYMDM